MAMPPDEELLLEFSSSEEALADARALIAKFGDAFRYQLVMAQFLGHNAAHLEELRSNGQMENVPLGKSGRIASPDYWDGYIQALRHTAEGLWAGEHVPGGSAFDETVSGEAF